MDASTPEPATTTEPRAHHGPSLWRGSEIAQREDWCHRLSNNEVKEIRGALAASAGLDLEAIGAEDFPLPSLGQSLARAASTLEEGCGSFLLRAWPAAEHSLEDNRRAFWGISRHLGTPISQSAKGDRIFHVENAGFATDDPRARGPNTSRGLSFHCDRCDVIGFLCVRQARSGGESFLVSSVALHNEILARRPDLLRVLYEPFYYKTHNVDRANPEPWCRQPVFAEVEGRFVGYLLRVLIDRAYAMPELPEMSQAQREALDLIDELAADPKIHHCFRQEPGDFFFVNNFVNFHSRSEFVDYPEAERRRLLLRIWLSVPNSRPLPPLFAGSFGRVRAGELRGGIHPAEPG